MKLTVQRHKHTKRLRPNHCTRECFPLTRTTTTLPKAYLLLFILPSTSHPVIKRKLQGILKGNKQSLKRKSKHQNWPWQGCWNFQRGNLKQWRLDIRRRQQSRKFLISFFILWIQLENTNISVNYPENDLKTSKRDSPQLNVETSPHSRQ